MDFKIKNTNKIRVVVFGKPPPVVEILIAEDSLDLSIFRSHVFHFHMIRQNIRTFLSYGVTLWKSASLFFLFSIVTQNMVQFLLFCCHEIYNKTLIIWTMINNNNEQESRPATKSACLKPTVTFNISYHTN